jgi:hypothetical protein
VADWKLGYKLTLVSNNYTEATANVRTSEASKVFNAMHLLCNGTSEDQLKGVQQMTELAAKGYHAFITECRSIIDKANGRANRASLATPPQPKRIVAEDIEKLSKRLAVSNPRLIAEVIESAQQTFIRQVGATGIGADYLVEGMLEPAKALAASQDKFYSVLGGKLTDLLVQAVLHSEKQKEAAIKAKQSEIDAEKIALAKQQSKISPAPTPATLPPEPGDIETNMTDEQLDAYIQELDTAESDGNQQTEATA